jgi:hypothetical protein
MEAQLRRQTERLERRFAVEFESIKTDIHASISRIETQLQEQTVKWELHPVKTDINNRISAIETDLRTQRERLESEITVFLSLNVEIVEKCEQTRAAVFGEISRLETAISRIGDICVPMSTSDRMSGIINYFLQKHIEAPTVEASSVSDPAYSAAKLLDNSSSYFWSKNQPNQFVKWDFRGFTLSPTQYSIRSYSGAKNSAHLKSWVVLGSLDGSHWNIVARQTDCEQLNQKSVVASFPFPQEFEGRFLILKQTGKNHRGDDVLAFSQFEIFGTIRWPKPD